MGAVIESDPKLMGNRIISILASTKKPVKKDENKEEKKVEKKEDKRAEKPESAATKA